jgi:hypothetical protein
MSPRHCGYRNKLQHYATFQPLNLDLWFDGSPRRRPADAGPVASKKTAPLPQKRAVGTRAGRLGHQRSTKDRVGRLFPSEKLVRYWYPAVKINSANSNHVDPLHGNLQNFNRAEPSTKNVFATHGIRMHKKRSEQMPEFGMPSTQCSRKRHVDGEHKKIVNNDKPPW